MICWHTASFKIWISKVQDFGKFELSPMNIDQDQTCMILIIMAYQTADSVMIKLVIIQYD